MVSKSGSGWVTKGNPLAGSVFGYLNSWGISRYDNGGALRP